MKNLATCALFFALLLASCSKEQVVNNLEIKVEDKVLRFDNTEHFQAVAEKIKEDAAFYEDRFSNLDFSSNFERFNSLEEEEIESMSTEDNSLFFVESIDDEKYIYQVIESPVFGRLVNDEGLIIIGEKAYKYVNQDIYIANATDLGLLRSNSYDAISNLQMDKIGQDVLHVTDAEVQTRVNIRYCNSYFSSNERGVGKIQANTYGVYWDVAVTTANWKKGFFGWYKLKADALENSGHVNIRYKNFPIGSWVYLNSGAYNSSYGVKKKDIYLTIKSWYTSPPLIEFLDADVEHKITDHGSLVTCNNSI